MSEHDQMQKVKCTLKLEFDSSESAEKVHRSVELDNQGYIATRVQGNVIIAEMKADSLNSLLHTLDDFLACAGVADKIVLKKD